MTLPEARQAPKREPRRYGGRRELTDPDWLSPRAVAGLLSVSVWQVRKWLECGQFDETVVFSKKLTRISRGSYQRFCAKNRQATA